MPSAFTPGHRGGSGPPLVCLHGLTDTWRSWELTLPELERHHDVLAPTLAGHAGGPALPGEVDERALADAVERAMDEAGFETAHITGNSLGGYVSLQLAARGRARSVVAFAPSGGWAQTSTVHQTREAHFRRLHELAGAAAPHAEAIVSSPEGRRRATDWTAVHYDHIPAGLLAHQIRGVAACDGLLHLLTLGGATGFPLDAEHIECPLRIVWGTEDKVLPWPAAAETYRRTLPHADWVVLDDVGHCPQLDVPTVATQLILGFTAG